MDWFGGLDLALKYAIVFGSALSLTLVAGLIKVMVDRQKMKRYMKDAEIDAGRIAFSDQSPIWLSIREKDEGDLFGIRAIEAGFYGGVAQSGPNSAANSPAGSRSGSPAPGRQTPKAHSPSSSTTLNGSKALTALKNSSASTTLLSWTQFQRKSNGRLDLLQPSQSNNFKVEPCDLAIEAHHPLDSVSPGHPCNTKLRPSGAELSGRMKHLPVDMALEVPPSPLFPTTPRTLGHEYTSSTNLHDLSPQKIRRASVGHVSHKRSASYDFPSQINSYDEFETSSQPALSPDYAGNRSYEIVSPTDDLHLALKSIQISIGEHTKSTVGSYWVPIRAPRPPKQPSKLPSFHKTAIIQSISPLFKGFAGERKPKEPQTARQDDFEESRGYFDQKESQRPISPTLTVAESPFTSHSRLNSPSFDMTYPDGYDSEPAYHSNIRPGHGEKQVSFMYQDQGTYQPRGAPPGHI